MVIWLIGLPNRQTDQHCYVTVPSINAQAFPHELLSASGPPETNEMASLDSHIQAGYPNSNGLTAKDSVLKNSYLIAETFSHLQVGNNKEHRLCLFNGALTCKDFLETALDALWEELDSLVPLLRLLPALQVAGGAYVLNGKVSQADWDRVEYYSRRVKVFQAMPSDTKNLQVLPSTYIRFAQLHRSPALLPSLRHLHCSLKAGSISHIFLLLSPSLESLEFTNIAHSEDILVMPFLAALSSPSLNRITLRTGQLSVEAFQSISQFKQLRSLELSDAILINEFLLQEVLGCLPCLAKLTLKAINSKYTSKVTENSKNKKREDRKGFIALENLCVTACPPLIRDLTSFIDSACLKSIEMHPAIDWNYIDTNSMNVDGGNLHPDLDNFNLSISTVGSKWTQTLKGLIIGRHHVGNSKPARPGYTFPRSGSVIKELMKLHEMQTFHVKDWKLRGNALRSLTISWPKLTTLILPIKQWQTPISLLTLRTIAENCPELRYLRIQLKDFVTPPSGIPSIALYHKLRVLSVGSYHDPPLKTTLQCQLPVARHLDLMFPCLESIQTHIGFNAEAWSDIRQLVKFCREVRQ